MSRLNTLLTQKIVQTMLDQDPNIEAGVVVPEAEFVAQKAELIAMVQSLGFEDDLIRLIERHNHTGEPFKFADLGIQTQQ